VENFENLDSIKQSFDKINNYLIERKIKNIFKINKLETLIANKFFHYLILNNAVYFYE